MNNFGQEDDAVRGNGFFEQKSCIASYFKMTNALTFVNEKYGAKESFEMANRIQLHIEDETILLARKTAEGHDDWLKEKVDAAFARLYEGKAVYFTRQQVWERMGNLKAKVRAKYHFE